jgi:hypothetical protein
LFLCRSELHEQLVVPMAREFLPILFGNPLGLRQRFHGADRPDPASPRPVPSKTTPPG